MDLKRQQWHEDTLKVFGIRLDMLAEIRSNAEVYGHMAEGPLKGVPIAGMLVPRDDPPSVAADPLDVFLEPTYVQCGSIAWCTS